jgi:hypothetical protein
MIMAYMNNHAHSALLGYAVFGVITSMLLTFLAIASARIQREHEDEKN